MSVHCPAIAPAPVSPWANGVPERGFEPPEFPKVVRVSGEGVVETVHSLPLAFSVPPAVPLRVRAPPA
jgi:hypothetical protein